MDNIHLIAKIIDFDSIILYNMLCTNKYINNELLNKITNNGLKYIPNIHTLNLRNNKNITDYDLKYIKNIYTLNLYWNENITDNGLKYIYNIHILNL
jgi:hypothetical protein